MFEKDFRFFPYELLFQARSERQLLFLNIFGYGSKSDFPLFALTSFSIAVIVNKENPTDGLTSDQVKSIYVGDTTDWADVK